MFRGEGRGSPQYYPWRLVGLGAAVNMKDIFLLWDIEQHFAILRQEAGLATKFRSQHITNNGEAENNPLDASAVPQPSEPRPAQHSRNVHTKRYAIWLPAGYACAPLLTTCISHVSVFHPQTPLKRGGRCGGMCDPAAEHQDGRRVCQTPLLHVGHTSSTGREL